MLMTAQFAVPFFAAAQNAAVISPSDQDLIVRVRQAGLWEMPSGAWAIQRAASDQVKQVGRTLMVDHGRLDVITRDMAAQYNIPLPDQPTADQQSWLMEEQNARNGAEFQQIFVNRLRAAHGVILGIIGQVRAGTKNDQIRAYATTANQVVLRHITLLESTGLVDYSKLPEPTMSSTASKSAAQSLDLGLGGIIAGAVVAVVVAIGSWWVLRAIRRPRRTSRRSFDGRRATPSPQPEI
jgi:predicted outer membrane protein